MQRKVVRRDSAEEMLNVGRVWASAVVAAEVVVDGLEGVSEWEVKNENGDVDDVAAEDGIGEVERRDGGKRESR